MDLVMRSIRTDDPPRVKRADEFLAAHPSVGVRPRPPAMVAKAQAYGQGLLITRAKTDADIGCSLVYGFEDGGDVHREIGTMRVIENGLGLQAFFARFHLFRLRMENYFGELPSVFAVVSGGTASAYNLQNKVGMKPWQPTPGLAASRGAQGLAFDPAKLTLLAGEICFAQAQAALLEMAVGDREFRLPNGETLTVDIKHYSNEELANVL